ncbi:MAG: RagB/SusD family nutrient uptake outer membrane protein, partial [Spirosomataceae bacterium]
LGNLERAKALVNEIRTRAANPAGFVPKTEQLASSRDDFRIVTDPSGNPVPAANYVIKTYDAPWTDKATARKAVRFEERLEFGMEGHRFFDLVRWGVASTVLNKYITEEKDNRAYLAGATFQKGKNEYFPIPLNAIDRSAKDGVPTLTQDPAY